MKKKGEWIDENEGKVNEKIWKRKHNGKDTKGNRWMKINKNN